jgi:hydrogenase nickel incorporation protein HypA/HybF
MHELPVTEGILKTSLEAAGKAGARRITAIDLVVGELSSIVDDSVQFYFDILSRDTLAAGATLRLRREAGMATCRDCGHEYPVRAPLVPLCPSCGGPRVRVSGGREFYVESIEVDDDEDSGGETYPERQRSGGG